MKSKFLITAIVVVVVVAACFFLLRKSRSASDEETEAPSLVNVQIGALTRATLHGYVDAFGTVSPAPGASARVASAVAGLVAKTDVTEGQAVRKGAVLFDLDSRFAEVAVARARHAADYARATAARQGDLLKSQNTSVKAVQDAQAQAAAADADLASAETQLAWTHITAPLAGVVTRINVRPGEAVDLTTPLGEIMDLTRLVISAEIPADDAAKVKLAQAVTVLSDRKAKASIGYIGPAVDPNTGTVMIRAVLAAGSRLRPGQYVHVRIITRGYTPTCSPPRPKAS